MMAIEHDEPETTYPTPWTNVRVESNGIGPGTRVLVGDVEMTGIVHVGWSVNPDEVSTVTITVEGAKVDVKAVES